MKRSELVRHLEKHKCVFLEEGGEHTFYRNTATGRKASIPRHHEVNTFTARKICKDLGVPRPPGK